MSPMVGEDALPGLFNVEATERAAYRIADRGTDRLRDNVRELTPVDTNPYRTRPARPRGFLRRSVVRRTTGGYAPRGFVARGIVRRGGSSTFTLTGTVYTDDPVARYVEEDTPPHTIRPKRPNGYLAFQSRHGWTDDSGRFHPPGTWVYVHQVEHPGTKGAHMFARGAMLTEHQTDDIASEPLRVWAREANRA